MKKFNKLFTYSLLFILPFSLLTYSQNKQTKKQDVEIGVITIKVKKGIGPFDKQSGLVSFGISSLDQLSRKYDVNSLSDRFQHKPISANSGLPDLSRIYRIEFPEKFNVVRVSKEFSKDPNIEYAEPIPINYSAHEPNDSLFSQMWHLLKIQSDFAWDIHKGQDGDSTIILAITDSGVDWDHPDLVDNIWNNLGEDADNDGHTIEWNGATWAYDPGDQNYIDDDGNGFIDDFIGWNVIANTNEVRDADYHGTAVAGVACGVTNNFIGIASISYNLEVMPVKGFRYNSIIYAAENSADVINCSWGTGVFSLANKDAIDYVTGLGSIVVAAAHNFDGDDSYYPASYPKVISVAAVDFNDIKTYYSNYGPSIDVSAPGPDGLSHNIWTTASWYLGGGYGEAQSGTSFATPIVTGLLGLIKSYHPTWARDQLVTQLLGTTENIDLLNPGYEYLLGTGRINAFYALDSSNVSVPQELKLHSNLLMSSSLSGINNFMSNEVVDIGLRVQNFSHDVGANNLTITLTTNDPDIQILDGEYVGSLPADDLVDLVDEFKIQISANAITHLATLSFHFSAEVPVVVGQVQEFQIFINPNGVFVWEGKENGQDYSGTYIRDYLVSQGYNTFYSAEALPLNFIGLDAVFLSFGNYGSQTVFDDYMAANVEEYLESGGRFYLEGGEALGWDHSGNGSLFSLLGLAGVNDGTDNAINSLQGQDSTITEAMLFTSSTQQSNRYIDKYFPNAMGMVSFYESGYGDVAVQSVGNYNQRTFCFSYALAELVDDDSPSTRDTLIQRILDFFEVEPLQLPSAPILIEPLNNTILNSGTVQFVWQKSQPEVERYWFEIDTTDQFSAPVFSDSTITDTTLLYDSLSLNKKYWWRVKAYNLSGWGEFSEVRTFDIIVSVEDENQLPTEFNLEQNFPNPFNPVTTIQYSVKERSPVELVLYDVLGREVELLVNEEQDAGYYNIEFNPGNLASGIYFYRLQAGSFVETKKMVLLK